MPLQWKIRDVDDAAIGRLRTELGVYDVTARCLAARGISAAEDARSYLDPRLARLRRPAGLAGLEEAVMRIGRAVLAGERIGVFGDYDVDGVTTAALITCFLRDLGAAVVPRVASRQAGYGFGDGDVRHFGDAGCQLIITGDCGTSDVVAIRAAAARGIDVVVVDHHTVPASIVPEVGAVAAAAPHPALALVNPFRGDSTFPFRGMASVGLSFYLMAAVRTHLVKAGWFRDGRPEPDLRELLDLVALGTVADLVPLQGENRILTAIGLRRLARRRRPGLAALLRVAGVGPDELIDERVIGWKLAPRLNAPGRLGDAEPALALLLARTDAEAEACAQRLEEVNNERREVQQRVLEEAERAVGDRDPGPAIVVAGAGWASGVVGIVAAKLVERYRRPAFVIAVDPASGEGRGSARTAGGVNLYDVLERCRPHLVRFGGHAAAAGLTVRAECIDAVRQAIHEAVADGVPLPPTEGGTADAEVELGQVDERLVLELDSLAPFGQGNEAPLLVARGLRVTASRRVGDGSHLKLELQDGTGHTRPAIGFGLGELDPGAGATVDAAFQPMVSTWRGRRRVELRLEALSP